MAEKLTPQQKMAVENRGGKLLVSAAAGSGKTKVLVDRLLGYLMDPNDPADLDQFLIITYTKAAASELRGKIADKLTQVIAANPANQHLQRQMQKLYMTQISTVHAFCTDILREYAYKVDVSADFRVADENECAQLQAGILESMLEELYDPDKISPAVYSFMETQGISRDDHMIPQLVLEVYKSSRCHLDPDAWLRKCAEPIAEQLPADPCETQWGAYLIGDLHRVLDLHVDALERCAEAASETDGFEKVQIRLSSDIEALRKLRSCTRWCEIWENRNVDYGRFPSIRKPSDPILLEKIKAVRDTAKKKISQKLTAFSDSAEQVLHDLKETSAAAKGLTELVFTFAEAYDKLKRSRRLMDFSDLEQRVLDLVLGKKRTAATAAAREISARFREVMVDEYQDSNAVQDAIFSALTEERQNCFMVGDVKQSIYQFRLADPTIFLQKYNTYLPAEEAKHGAGRKILLSSNFRSSAGVLSAANDVFSRCMSPQVGGLYYTEAEMLREGIPHCDIQEPEVELYGVTVSKDTYAEEAAFTAERICQLLDGTHFVRDGENLRPIQPQDIVILLRSPKSVGGEFSCALAQRGVRCVMDGDIDLLKTDEVNAIHVILQMISNPLQDVPLIAAMSGKAFGFTADELASIRSRHKTGTFYEAVVSDGTEKTNVFLKNLRELRDAARLLTLSQLVDRILLQTHLDSCFCSMPDGAIRMANIQAFCQIISEFESVGNRDLLQLLQYLDAMAEKGLYVSGKQGSGAVSITSIHKSKGLEYPVVFLCGLSKRFNQEDTVKSVLCDGQLGLGLFCVDKKNRLRYPSISKRAITAKMIEQSISEELRVLYVAMTRAKDRLIMTFASNRLESVVSDIVSRMDMSGSELMSGQVSCAGSWVLQTALSKTEAGELFALGGRPSETVVSNAPWLICVCSASDSCGEYTETEFDDKQELPEEVIKRIGDSLAFEYPYEAAISLPSKQTATQLKGREKDHEITENSPVPRKTERFFRAPSFAGDTMSGRKYGNAIHAVMQYIDYARCDSRAAVQMEINRLEREQFISPEQASAVDVDAISSFFASPLGVKLRDAKHLLREYKFSVLNDVSEECHLPAEDKILLQGVVDCALIEDDGITIVDFKTDKVTPKTVGDLSRKYHPQVMAYAEAMQRIFQKPVKTAYLYLFQIGSYIDILKQ